MRLNYFKFYRTTFAGTKFHTHDHYQLHYVIDGDACYEIENRKKIKVGTGDFFIVYPQEKHRIMLREPDELLVEYLLGCNFDGDCAFMKNFFDFDMLQHRKLSGRRMSRQFFEGLKQQLLDDNAHIRQSAFLRLFSRICGIYGSSEEMTYSSVIEDALSIMQDQVEGCLDLTKLCKSLGICKSHFIRTFKRYTGTPPMRYFTQLKIETAKTILLQSDMSLGEIAERLSFTDAFHLSRTFKKHVGTSPSCFRTSFRHKTIT